MCLDITYKHIYIYISISKKKCFFFLLSRQNIFYSLKKIFSIKLPIIISISQKKYNILNIHISKKLILFLKNKFFSIDLQKCIYIFHKKNIYSKRLRKKVIFISQKIYIIPILVYFQKLFLFLQKKKIF